MSVIMHCHISRIAAIIVTVLTVAPAFSPIDRTCLAEEPAAKAPAGKSSPAKSTSTDTLDDELLKGLGGQPPVKKPAEPKPADSATPPTKPSAGKKPAATNDLDDELLKGLGGESKPATKADNGKPSESTSGKSDPVSRLTEQMREVEQRLRRNERDDSLKPRQEEIVRQLDELLQQMKQQQQQQSKSSSKKPSQGQSQSRQDTPQPGQQQQQAGQKQQGDKPAQDSNDDLKRRQAEKVDMAKMQEMLKDIWGQLPPRLREQMMQAGVEKFVPKYELLIEEYFKALAERQNTEGR